MNATATVPGMPTPAPGPRRPSARIPRIAIEGLRFGYDASGTRGPVLDSFDLTVAESEFLSIVGPSGCGKSTLLGIIAGLLAADSGTVLIDGMPRPGPGPDRAMVFQEDAVFPWRTVAGNVAYGLEVRGASREERRRTVDEYLALVGLTEARDLYPRQLSGGMRKRVDVARAIAVMPRILLLDEPFAALDVMTKEQVQVDFLDIWATSRMTAVFVTHDLEEALFLSDRVVVMSRDPGRIIHDVRVPFGRPRHRELRTSPEFQALRAALAGELRAVIGDLEAR
jgi:NitT/TauT family transport system ATP-binding protein